MSSHLGVPSCLASRPVLALPGRSCYAHGRGEREHPAHLEVDQVEAAVVLGRTQPRHDLKGTLPGNRSVIQPSAAAASSSAWIRL